MTYRVALVDDDADFTAELTGFLEDHGCAVWVFPTGDEFFAGVAATRPDILILDLRLPRESGIHVLRRLRETSGLPCIMLTGAASEVDRILSLELGADDHVTKTAPPRELLARIAAVLRRTGRALPPGEWRLDEARQDVLRPDGEGCGLTAAEYRVCIALVHRPGQPVTRETICQEALGRPWHAEDRSVDVLVAKLRRKLGGQGCIRSLRGNGYAFIRFGAT